MIRDWDDFHFYVGRTIMHCQTIEHDIKLIYAGMKAGDMDENLNLIDEKKMTLGMVLKNLKELDYSDNNHFFSEGDYDLLKNITEIRNHWAHKAYCEFVYSDNESDFIRQARRLENDHNRLEKLSETIEKVRFKALRQYGRLD
jgi:hypothetical protein